MQRKNIRKKAAGKRNAAVKKHEVTKLRRKKAAPAASKKKSAAGTHKDNTLMVRIKSVFDETAAKLKTLLPGDAPGQSSSVRAPSKK